MRFLIVLFLGCTLMACNRPAAEAPGTDAGTPAATTSPATETETAATAPAVDPANCEFCADPAVVRTCDVAAGVATTLHWNVKDPKVTSVGIYVVDDAGKDSPFAEQPPAGSLKTGPWLKPGLTFKLKDKDANVLKSLVIEGKAC